jgi:hypothetical protein
MRRGALTKGALGVCLLGCAVAASGPALGQSGRAFKVKVAHRTTTVTQISLSELPTEVMPPPLDDAKKPSLSFADAPEVADLKVVPQNAADAIRWKTRSGNDWLSVRLEPGLGSGWATVGFTQNTQFTQRNVAANCSASTQHQYYTQPKGVRWERLTVADSGVATLEINDGWFDPRSCKVKVEKRTVLHPKTVVTREGVPLLWAVRGEDEITLLFPPDATVVTDSAAPHAPSTHGALTRVTLSVKRGVSAMALAEINPSVLTTFLQGLLGKPGAAGSVPSISTSTALGVDVMQTVSDPEPTILIRSTAQF